MTRDDFDYALENTRVILAPERQIATFGSTSFNFYLISELMDRVDQVRIRNGRIHAERPQILTPEHYCRLLLEGFGEKAERYIDQLREHARSMAVLRYGFQFRKTDLSEQTLRDSIDSVINRTRRKVESKNESLSAVIHGVDDAWEVCLLKFTIDLVERSSGNNLGDFRKRGLIWPHRVHRLFPQTSSIVMLAKSKHLFVFQMQAAKDMNRDSSTPLRSAQNDKNKSVERFRVSNLGDFRKRGLI